jgi:hypothetical protein
MTIRMAAPRVKTVGHEDRTARARRLAHQQVCSQGVCVMPRRPPVFRPPHSPKPWASERERKAALDRTRPSRQQRGYDKAWFESSRRSDAGGGGGRIPSAFGGRNRRRAYLRSFVANKVPEKK